MWLFLGCWLLFGFFLMCLQNFFTGSSENDDEHDKEYYS